MKILNVYLCSSGCCRIRFFKSADVIYDGPVILIPENLHDYEVVHFWSYDFNYLEIVIK